MSKSEYTCNEMEKCWYWMHYIIEHCNYIIEMIDVIQGVKTFYNLGQSPWLTKFPWKNSDNIASDLLLYPRPGGTEVWLKNSFC